MTANEDRLLINPPLLGSLAIALGVVAFSFVLLNAVSVSLDPPAYGYAVPVRLGNAWTFDLTSDHTHCPAHGLPLSIVKVLLVHGLLMGPFPSSFDEKDFPFGDTWISGGCCLEFDSPSSAKVSQCRECVVARRVWMLTHTRVFGDAPAPKLVEMAPNTIDLWNLALPFEPTFDISTMKGAWLGGIGED